MHSVNLRAIRGAYVRKIIPAARCDGLERQPVQNVVLLITFIIGLCILRMTRTCQRLAGTFGSQLSNVYPV